MSSLGALAPPPPSWTSLAMDVASPSAVAPREAITDIEQVSTAWKHIKTVCREDAKSADLYDLLSHSVRETQYSFQPQGVRPGRSLAAWCLGSLVPSYCVAGVLHLSSPVQGG